MFDIIELLRMSWKQCSASLHHGDKGAGMHISPFIARRLTLSMAAPSVSDSSLSASSQLSVSELALSLPAPFVSCRATACALGCPRQHLPHGVHGILLAGPAICIAWPKTEPQTRQTVMCRCRGLPLCLPPARPL